MVNDRTRLLPALPRRLRAPCNSCCRSGKTSIARVVFGRLPPHEAAFVEPSAAPVVYVVGSSSHDGAVGAIAGGNAHTSGGAATKTSNSPPALDFWLWDWPASELRGGGGSGPPALDARILRCAVFCDAAEDEPGVVEALLAGGSESALADAAPTATVISVLPGAALASAAGIVFVWDASDEPPFTSSADALRKLAKQLRALDTARRAAGGAARARAARPALPHLDIFVHKSDGEALAAAAAAAGRGGGARGGGAASAADVGGGTAARGGVAEARAELLREVMGAALSELSDAGFDVVAAGGATSLARSSATASSAPVASARIALSVAFHFTSIYDRSTHAAMSKVVRSGSF